MDLEAVRTQSEYHTPANWPRARLDRFLPGKWLRDFGPIGSVP